MAILHIIANHLDADAISKLVDRSDVNDGYAFMDDGVYVLLSKAVTSFGPRPVYVLANHADERGLLGFKDISVQLIQMPDLVGLTASYAASMSW